MKHITLEIKNFLGDHAEVSLNGKEVFNTKNVSDICVTLCQFLDLTPTDFAENFDSEQVQSRWKEFVDSGKKMI